MIPIREENEVFYEYYMEGFSDEDYKECAALLSKEEALQVCEVLKANPDAKFCDLPKRLYEELKSIALNDAIEHGFPGESKEYGTKLCMQEEMPEDFIDLLEKEKVTDVESPIPVADSNINMMEKKILTLTLKKKFADEILAGTKTQEFREVRPTTIKKLLQLDEDGYEIEDEHQNSIPIKYDAIKFLVGKYEANRDMILVEVKDAYCEMFTETVCDGAGNPIKFLIDENGYYVRYAKPDENGFCRKDENGNVMFAKPEDKEAGPYVIAKEGEPWAYREQLIEYEYDGKLWYAEQVVYNLGRILEYTHDGKVYTPETGFPSA